MDRFELAWAAGFFDGEGWANAVAQEGRKTKQPQARINQADPNGVPEVLLRFQRAVGGLGRIGGPYVMEGRDDLYWWQISSRGDVELLHHFLLPWLGQVKLHEFAVALERPSAASRPCGTTDDWRAWAAGLYDGEGSVYLLDHRTHDNYHLAEMCVTQCGRDTLAPEVLRRFAEIAGVGHINGPYAQEEPYSPVWRFKSAAWSDIVVVLESISPWLGPVKQTQAREAREVIESQPPLPRGNPAWGNRKTHCINGHEYASARLRPYLSRGKGVPPRDSHQCLVCARQQARVRRLQRNRWSMTTTDHYPRRPRSTC